MRNRILGIAVGAVLIAGAAILGLAHGFQGPGGHGKGGHGDMHEHMARALGLTDAQRTQAKAIMDSIAPTAEATHAKLQDIHKQLEAATANGQFDEAQVRNLAGQQAQLEADLRVEHLRAKSKVYSILTAEQRAKAEELHKRMGPRERHPGPPPGL